MPRFFHDLLQSISTPWQMPGANESARGSHGPKQPNRATRTEISDDNSPLLNRRLFIGACSGLILGSLCGCSLVVMANKMISGDPTQTAKFTATTHVNLIKDKKRVLIVATAPASTRAEVAALDQDIIEGLGRRLKREGIKIVDANKVASWIEDRGGRLGDPSEIANEFKTDYVIHVDIEEFKYREDNSTSLYRGQVRGSVHVYEVKKKSAKKQVNEVFVTDIGTTWPDGNPIEGDQRKGQVFLNQFISRICDQLGLLFYDHPASATVL